MGRVFARMEGARALVATTEAELHERRLASPVSGTVYGVVLNSRTERQELAEALQQAPYKAPPEAPVLYIKTPNTLNRHGGTVVVPAGLEALEVNATLAVVIGRTACRTPQAQALDHVLGYTIALDVCEPHASYYRPAIRQRCRDGFLPIGPWVVPAADFTAPDAAEIIVEMNGVEASRWSTADLVRPVSRLIADVSDFMTLTEGDVLLAGLAPRPARARAGDQVCARIDGLGHLNVTLEGEPA